MPVILIDGSDVHGQLRHMTLSGRIAGAIRRHTVPGEPARAVINGNDWLY